MSKKKHLENGYPKLLLANHLDSAIFYWVSGIRHFRPTVHLNAAIEEFADFMRFELTEFSIENAITTYYRMLAKYRQSYDIKEEQK